MRSHSFFQTYRWPMVISAIFIVYTLLLFGIYYERTLHGDINHHMLSSDMFGVPSELQEKGITPLYYGDGNTGWDGQFYYYMANDILARKDTALHIDAPSYRYQRIGLSFYTATIATLLGQDWVSPSLFFISYLGLLVAAVWVGARFFTQLGVRPGWILLWGLSIGTQITLYNALPDAAADAFLILALAALYYKRYLWSAIPFTLAALSREVYVLFPSLLWLFYLFDTLLGQQQSSWRDRLMYLLRWQPYHYLLLPGVIAIAWLIYIALHFGIWPSEQAHGILGFPMHSWFDYFLSGIRGQHKLIGGGYGAYAEATCLLLFLGMLLLSAYLAVKILLRPYQAVPVFIRGVALTMLGLVLLYACFSRTVMMHYTGYLKAASIFLLFIPVGLAFANISAVKQKRVVIFLVIALLLMTAYFVRNRILPYRALKLAGHENLYFVTKTEPIACFGEYRAAVAVRDVAIQNNTLLANIFAHGGWLVVDTVLTNTSQYPFVSTQNVGGVYMSYHWLDKQGNVVQDGIRSALPEALLPGESVHIPIVTPFPGGSGQYTLQLSPVQEGCAWFYQHYPMTAHGVLSVNR